MARIASPRVALCETIPLPAMPPFKDDQIIVCFS
jgi:hypothetical protein